MTPGLLLASLLTIAPLPSAPPTVATVTLRGQAVPMPGLKSASGKAPRVGLFVSAEEEVLRKTLQRRGWVELVAKDGPALGQQNAALHLARAGGQQAWLWKRPQQIYGLPLWAVAVGGANPDAQLLERDLQAGLSTPRKVVNGPGLAWIQLVAPPDEGAEEIDPAKMTLPPVVSEVETSQKQVALTFDACSTLDPSRYDQRVIDILVREKVPATLFIGGRWAEEHPDTLKTLGANPLFEIGNHTYSHAHMADVPTERMRDELARTQKAIFALTGRTPTLWRPPYGEYSLRVVAEAARQGLTTVEYDLASGDPDPKVAPEKIAEWVKLKAHPGSIVVMHMNGPSRHTFEALPQVIKALRAKGYSFATVSELLHPAPAPTPPSVAGAPTP